MIEYYSEMDKQGMLNKNEVKFIKKGIVFKHLKLVHLNMRPDELAEREHFMKTGSFTKWRPRSTLSNESKNS